MAILAMDAPPQFVFVGRPEFWEVTNRTAPSQFEESDHRTLGTGPTECGHNTRLYRAVGRLTGAVDRGRIRRRRGLAALMQKSDGLFGRIVALLTRARANFKASAVSASGDLESVIEAAAALDDGGNGRALDYGRASAKFCGGPHCGRGGRSRCPMRHWRWHLHLRNCLIPRANRSGP